MKRLLILIAFIGLFSQQIFAGKALNCSDCDPPLGGYFVVNNGGAKTAKGTINLTNAAYFNVKDAPVRKLSASLQTRSTGIEILETDYLTLLQPNMRQQAKFAASATTATMDIGIADNSNPQTWTVPSGITIIRTLNTDFIDPTTIPLAAQVAGATHVGKRTIIDPDDNHTLTEYVHYYIPTTAGEDDLMEMGSTFVDVNDANAVADRSETAKLFADAPLNLNDAFTSEQTQYRDDSPLPKIVETSAITPDAFGSIVTPFGTYQCLRLSLSNVVTNYLANGTSTTTTEYYVAWVTKEGFRFYGKKPAQASSGSVVLTKLQMARFMPTPILAVELIDFQGIATKDGVDLTWTTASEKNNDFYDIERSTDGKTFEAIGQINGNGTTNAKSRYQFHAEGPLSITTYFRLKQTDFDGTSTTSNVIAIAPKSPKGTLTVYPNPSNSGSISVEISGNTEGVSVINAIGQTVFQQKTKNLSTLTIDVSAFTAGVYFIKTDGNTEGVKFIKH